eukprot:CAMPEP_0198200378 /NCGR_PEP_ID=MMETSP1445-20131203/3404_1 /TAXON_ID=36898 /ORGANISM="Pyramimonas sp., Strain CCMP2087" /LENGTH=260 /DNA_ID=CAMNT_0043870433 /DNA_START=90 /DNA_END=872 /DNA_ORIENTATION=+
MGLKSAYLFVYNSLLVIGWSYILHMVVDEVRNGGGTKNGFLRTRKELEIAQTAAILEVVHSALGLVRSPFATTLLQVASRIGILWGVLIAIPFDSRTAQIVLYSKMEYGPPGCLAGGVANCQFAMDPKIFLNSGTMIIAWSLSEIIRYTFYAVKELLGYVPRPIEWLRYSAFIVLYPIGVGSELTMVYIGMPYMKNNHTYDLLMPNAYNFAFSYYTFLLIGTILYIPGFPKLYFYMLASRKKLFASWREADRAKIAAKQK